MIEEQVILVDPQGRELGVQEKMQAHRDGVLHLAFSVLLYRDGGNEREFLMHQRALGKYHSGGLWTNTCCSHPRLGESMAQAGIRRLEEEMGIVDIRTLSDVASFVYRAELDNDLVEHELDHVLMAPASDIVINPNPEEVLAYRWWAQSELLAALDQEPHLFTAWFPQVLVLALANA
ncbi:isopentenyl-diphosphate Delta-isomerase [Photobacterium sp. DNB23_23_1]|uniref:Isopentenyl-diphosphate Delta-isomerase n=1 Tax=Photobacterium pectinilyticum TaxID=2906793 RepID=A0ABT1N7A7_9GAMM|nr:isopentenyl-diphosphate Delta-isomerase [Photobacterium sp. ZSDE20]MCQ1060633.1 isopentenyl-diphosphate Delta-isomerase [Photobacterium sp. ZSDE20]MDD1828109.1 isopentenyl-diphosphate Delta-isomerase [Photobacterium sp. ZSDE20]